MHTCVRVHRMLYFCTPIALKLLAEILVLYICEEVMKDETTYTVPDDSPQMASEPMVAYGGTPATRRTCITTNNKQQQNIQLFINFFIN